MDGISVSELHPEEGSVKSLFNFIAANRTHYRLENYELKKALIINRFSGYIGFEDIEANAPQDKGVPLYGIIGKVDFFTGPVYITITQCEAVLKLDGNVVYRILDIAILPILGIQYESFPNIAYNETLPDLPMEKERLQRKLYIEIRAMFSSGNYYFSFDSDITHNTQERVLNKEANKGKTLIEMADDHFFFNKESAQYLIDQELSDWAVVVMQGSMQIQRCFTNGNSYVIAVISRRSRKRSGLRFKRRGIDEKGNCANFVETEQIVTYNNDISSFVQIRGSVPTYWSQPGFAYRPVPVIDAAYDDHDRMTAFQTHVSHNLNKYGKTIMINLVDHFGNEKIISDTFFNLVNLHRNFKGQSPIPQCQPPVSDISTLLPSTASTPSISKSPTIFSSEQKKEQMREHEDSVLHSLSSNDLEGLTKSLVPSPTSTRSLQTSTPPMTPEVSKDKRNSLAMKMARKESSEICHTADGKQILLSTTGADELDHLVTRRHLSISNSIDHEINEEVKYLDPNSTSPARDKNETNKDRDYQENQIPTIDTQPVDSPLVYVSFDFHKHCTGTDYSKMWWLLKDLRPYLDVHGFLWGNSQFGLQQTQSGICRTNCMDCLDRTNVVQSMIAKRQLIRQLYALGVMSVDTDKISSDAIDIFHEVWANNGDAVSMLYAGTDALKGDFTRTGKRAFAGLLSDGFNSITRFFNNQFKDFRKQQAIDFLLQERTMLELLEGEEGEEGQEDDEEDEEDERAGGRRANNINNINNDNTETDVNKNGIVNFNKSATNRYVSYNKSSDGLPLLNSVGGGVTGGAIRGKREGGGATAEAPQPTPLDIIGACKTKEEWTKTREKFFSPVIEYCKMNVIKSDEKLERTFAMTRINGSNVEVPTIVLLCPKRFYICDWDFINWGPAKVFTDVYTKLYSVVIGEQYSIGMFGAITKIPKRAVKMTYIGREPVDNTKSFSIFGKTEEKDDYVNLILTPTIFDEKSKEDLKEGDEVLSQAVTALVNLVKANHHMIKIMHSSIEREMTLSSVATKVGGKFSSWYS